jgi:short subunit dehydrogenase-like uncharacterized protein
LILVYGASGFTGSLTARALLAHGLEVALSGRDRQRLEAVARDLPGPVSIRPAALHDRGALSAALEKAEVVIGCAGPFLHVGEPLVAAAVEAGVPYLDSAAEQAFLRDVYERYESQARKSRVLVVPGFAFEAALGDWAAARAAEAVAALDGGQRPDAHDFDAEPLAELMVAYALDRFRPSSGTQQSVLAQLARPAAFWLEDRWEPTPPGGELRSFRFPPPFGERDMVSFPSGESITVPRHLKARRVQTYLALLGDAPGSRWLARAARAVAPALPALMNSPLGAFARARAGGSAPHPSEKERREASFAVVAEATRSFQRARVAVLGSDPYALTAELLARAAVEICAGVATGVGVLAPTEAFAPARWLAELVRDGLVEVLES